MTPKDVLLTVLSEADALDVLEHRRVTIRKPMTTRAAQIMVNEMVRFGNPAQAVEIMIAKAWQGFNADWVRDRPRNSMDAAQNLIARINEQDREDSSHQGDYRDVQLLPSAARH